MSAPASTLPQTIPDPDPGPDSSPDSGDVTLTQKRAFLESGRPWPNEAPPDCVETHASYVFLTRDRAASLVR